MHNITTNPEHEYVCDWCGSKYDGPDISEIRSKGHLPPGWISCYIKVHRRTCGHDEIIQIDRRVGKLVVADEFVYCGVGCMQEDIFKLIQEKIKLNRRNSVRN